MDISHWQENMPMEVQERFRTLLKNDSQLNKAYLQTRARLYAKDKREKAHGPPSGCPKSKVRRGFYSGGEGAMINT